MATEQLSTEQLREILKNEGCVFHPIGDYEVPQLTDIDYGQFGQEEAEDFHMGVERLARFIRSEPVSDRFGSNHEARVKWRGQMAQKYGEPFLTVYYHNNPFRMNSLASVRLGLLIIAEEAEKCSKPFSSRVREMIEELNTKLKPYNGIAQVEEKLRVVNFVKERAVETLNLLAKRKE
jgi:hypothetical protein